MILLMRDKFINGPLWKVFMTSLSVVTIIKDQEYLIHDLVDHVLAFADEHVVVDTGSSDRTAQFAEESGAKVVEYRGPFDYSSPRNLGNSAATGDWVLHLDDDERISRTSVSALYHAIDCEGVDQFDVSQYTPGNCTVSVQTRLFKNTGDFAFGGKVHEWLYPLGRRAKGNILIEHFPGSNRSHYRVNNGRRELALKELETIPELFERDLPQAIDRAKHISGFLTAPEGTSYHQRIIGMVNGGDFDKYEFDTLVALADAILHFSRGPHIPEELSDALVERADDSNITTLLAAVENGYIGKNLSFNNALDLLNRASRIYDSHDIHRMAARIHCKRGNRWLETAEVEAARRVFPDNPMRVVPCEDISPISVILNSLFGFGY